MLKSWVQLGRRIAASSLQSLENPYKLTYVVTKECHSRCVNCKIWQVKPQNELTLDEVTRFARANPHFSWIDFTGGEPTDRPDLPEIVGAFLQANPALLLVHYPTNGLKPDRIEETTRRILALRPPRLVISVSIDGPPAVNDGLRGVKGDFDTATETYRRLSSLKGLQVYAGMTLYPKNVALVDETVAAIQERIPGFTHRNLHLNFPHLSEHYYGNRDTPSAHMIRESDLQAADFKSKIICTLADHARKKGGPRAPFEWVEWLYQRKLGSYLAKNKTPLECAALLSSLYLSEDGTVYPCLIWSKPLGNIRDTDYRLRPLLDSALGKKTREQARTGDCPQCWTPCEAYQTLAANLTRPVKLITK